VRALIPGKAQERHPSRGKARTDAGDTPILARYTVRNILATLRAILNQAVEDGLIATNPAARFGRYLAHRRDLRASVQALTEAEVSQVLAAAERWYPEYRDFAAPPFFTGVRLGDALGLQ
jgi:integrase